MKRLLLALPIAMTTIVFSYQMSLGQTQANPKPVVYKMWIKSIDKSFKAKGYLQEIGDSTIVLTDRRHTKQQTIQGAQIQTIKYRPRHAVLKGIGIGAALGVGIGGMIGVASGSDTGNCFICFSAGDKAIIWGTLLGVPSTILGGILQSKKEKVTFSGDQADFDDKKWLLKPYMLNKDQ